MKHILGLYMAGSTLYMACSCGEYDQPVKESIRLEAVVHVLEATG